MIQYIGNLDKHYTTGGRKGISIFLLTKLYIHYLDKNTYILFWNVTKFN